MVKKWPSTVLALTFTFAFLVSDAVAGERELQLDDHGYAAMGPLAAEPAVGKEQVPVAAFFGMEQSRGYVSIDLPVVLGEVRRLELRMKEDADANAAQVAPELANIVSCQLLSPFDSGEQQGQPPTEECAAPIRGERRKSGVWIFDLTRYARSWAEGRRNHGVSLRFGLRSTSQTWRVVFDAKASGAILVARSKEDGGSLAGPGPLTQPPPSEAGSTAFAGAPFSTSRTGQTDAPPARPLAEAASPIPPMASAPVSSGSADDEEQLRLPLVTLVLVPALAGLAGFALRWRRLAYLLDANAALGPASPAPALQEEGASHER